MQVFSLSIPPTKCGDKPYWQKHYTIKSGFSFNKKQERGKIDQLYQDRCSLELQHPQTSVKKSFSTECLQGNNTSCPLIFEAPFVPENVRQLVLSIPLVTFLTKFLNNPCFLTHFGSASPHRCLVGSGQRAGAAGGGSNIHTHRHCTHSCDKGCTSCHVYADTHSP